MNAQEAPQKRPPRRSQKLIPLIAVTFLTICTCVFVGYYARLAGKMEVSQVSDEAEEGKPQTKQERNDQIRAQALRDEEVWRKEMARRKTREKFVTIPTDRYIDQRAAELSDALKRIGRQQPGLLRGTAEELNRVNKDYH